MLNRARGSLERLLDTLGVAKIPLKPNTITVVALAVSTIVPVIAYVGVPYPLVALALLVTASFDSLDGYIARKRGLQSSFGAFLDSTLDRISDALYTCTLLITGVVSFAQALALLTAEYLVSYTRARAESLGVSLAGVGLMERGERTVFKAAILISASFHIGVARALTVLLIILTIMTAIQRIVAAKRLLESICRG